MRSIVTTQNSHPPSKLKNVPTSQKIFWSKKNMISKSSRRMILKEYMLRLKQIPKRRAFIQNIKITKRLSFH